VCCDGFSAMRLVITSMMHLGRYSDGNLQHLCETLGLNPGTCTQPRPQQLDHAKLKVNYKDNLRMAAESQFTFPPCPNAYMPALPVFHFDRSSPSSNQAPPTPRSQQMRSQLLLHSRTVHVSTTAHGRHGKVYPHPQDNTAGLVNQPVVPQLLQVSNQTHPTRS
jgi:hypothetical protein